MPKIVVRFQVTVTDFTFLHSAKTGSGPTRLPGLFTERIERPEHKPITHFHVIPKLRMSGPIRHSFIRLDNVGKYNVTFAEALLWTVIIE
jgi:hypothetical protein